MTNPADFRYIKVIGYYEIAGTVLGLTACAYFYQEIKSFLEGHINYSGLIPLLNKEPVLTRIVIGAMGAFAGYVTGKVLGGLSALLRKRGDRDKKGTTGGLDARAKWFEQISQRTEGRTPRR